MAWPNAGRDTLIGVGFGLPLLALAALGHEAAGLPFPPYDGFDLLVRWLPGALVSTALEAMVGLLQSLTLGPTAVIAKELEAALAWAQALGVLGVLGALQAAFARRVRGPWISA